MTWRTTRLRLVWRPPYYHGVRKSSIWRPIRRNRARRAPYGDGHGRKTRAREKGRGKHRARGRLGARGERSAGEIREQREERSQGRRTYLLARANAFAHAAGRSCCRRGSASPSPVPHPREEQPPAGCCFPVASSGPPLSRAPGARRASQASGGAPRPGTPPSGCRGRTPPRRSRGSARPSRRWWRRKRKRGERRAEAGEGWDRKGECVVCCGGVSVTDLASTALEGCCVNLEVSRGWVTSIS